MQSLSYARALYDFSPSAPGELAVKANDIILITEFGDDGWWDAQITRKDGTEEMGVVPEVYCTLLKSSTDKYDALSQHKRKKVSRRWRGGLLRRRLPQVPTRRKRSS